MHAFYVGNVVQNKRKSNQGAVDDAEKDAVHYWVGGGGVICLFVV